MQVTAISLNAPAATPMRAKHPPGLSTLFFTEMWERFSYYGMRALLVIYLVEQLHYERKDALALYGTYTGLVYMTPIIGGYIADRWLGVRNAIFVGMITMMLGHFAMAFESSLHLALGLLIAGNGFFKPNTTATVGKIYDKDDPRIPAGYTIFYMGINVGSALSTVIAGQLGEKLGYHYGFASAGVGMALGIVIFLLGQHRLGSAGLKAGQQRVDKRDWAIILGLSAFMVPLVLCVLATVSTFSSFWQGIPVLFKLTLALLLISAAILLPSLLKKTGSNTDQQPLTRGDYKRMGVILIMSLFVICFWMGFEQAGGTLTLFAKQNVDRTVFGYQIPASQFMIINPIAVITLAPLFALLWQRFKIPDFTKQGLGLLMLGLSFCVMSLAQQRSDEVGLVSMHWLFMVFLINTLAELLISPIGLSIVSRLAPARFASVLMGIWMLASSIANFLAGRLEHLLEGTGIHLFWFLAGTALTAGIVLLIISPLLTRTVQEAKPSAQ